MRILIVSDIHANLEALEACLAATSQYDRVVNLGDIVGYGASPNEVIDRLRSLDALHIRGNHDKACAGIVNVDTFNAIAAYAAYWTRDMLTPSNKRWLAELPAGPITMENAPGIQFAHGSPLDEDEYIILNEDAWFAAEGLETPVTFFGHTHIQGGFCFEANAVHSLQLGKMSGDGHRVRLASSAIYLVNPGSVGQPRDGDSRAAFAIYDTETREVSYHRVAYDIELAQRKIREAQLPERLASRLSQGR